MTEQDMEIWEGRRKALFAAIDNFIESLRQKTSPPSTSLAQMSNPELAARSKKTSVVGQNTEKEQAVGLAELLAYDPSTTVLVEPEPPSNGANQPPALPPEQQQEVENLINLALSLKRFAEDHLEFFYDGFVGSKRNGAVRQHKKYLLNLSREFPPDYVFTTILNQVAEDLELIRRVADQRLSTEMGLELRKADKLAWSALEPAVKLSKLGLHADKEDIMVMTYFQKSASIRIVPYAPVALIAVPFTSTAVPRDYLAIPHEVGHYVYRHAKIEGKSIPQALGRKLMEPDRSAARWARRWKEEIFADVYGCLIGGPVIALSFRDMSLQTSRLPFIQTPGEYLYGQFTEDDGVHPVPVVRPHVYTTVLRRMIWMKSADLIDDHWKKLPEVREATEFRTRYAGPNVEYINVEEAKIEITKIIQVIFELLETNELFRKDWSSNPEGDSLDEIYDKFEERGKYQGLETGFNRVINRSYPPKSLKSPGRNLWPSWVKNENFFPGIKDAPPQKEEAEPQDKLIPIDPGKAQRLEELEQDPRYTWNHVFLAGGWATKLPGTAGAGVVIPKNWRGVNQAGGASGGGY